MVVFTSILVLGSFGFSGVVVVRVSQNQSTNPGQTSLIYFGSRKQEREGMGEMEIEIEFDMSKKEHCSGVLESTVIRFQYTRVTLY